MMDLNEDLILSLLNLKKKIEQELRVDIIQYNDLEKEIYKKRQWIRDIETIVARGSFIPADSLYKEASPAKGKVPSPSSTKPVQSVADFDKTTINIADNDNNDLLASIKFLEEIILISFNNKVLVELDNELFQKFFMEKIINIFKKEGGKIFIEKGDDGYIKSITIKGSFSGLLKDKLVKSLKYMLNKVHKN
ncbi:MAG: hypothetical protein ACTSVI_01045 [Promethearchaeota archaeon]